jgi:hypothetical protein
VGIGVWTLGRRDRRRQPPIAPLFGRLVSQEPIPPDLNQHNSSASLKRLAIRRALSPSHRARPASRVRRWSGMGPCAGPIFLSVISGGRRSVSRSWWRSELPLARQSRSRISSSVRSGSFATRSSSRCSYGVSGERQMPSPVSPPRRLFCSTDRANARLWRGVAG